MGFPRPLEMALAEAGDGIEPGSIGRFADGPTHQDGTPCTTVCTTPGQDRRASVRIRIQACHPATEASGALVLVNLSVGSGRWGNLQSQNTCKYGIFWLPGQDSDPDQAVQSHRAASAVGRRGPPCTAAKAGRPRLSATRAPRIAAGGPAVLVRGSRSAKRGARVPALDGRTTREAG